MKFVKLATDKVLDKLVGKVDAYAACPPDTYYPCVVNGVCSTRHERKRCWTKPDCSGVTCVSSGCC